MALETRALPGATIENVDEERHTVDARVLSYRQADTYGTVWEPGCMSESLKVGNPVILAHHDMSRPIGKVISHRDGSDALELTIQMADLDSVPDARTAFSLMRDNVISGWSVGFQRNKWDPVPDDKRAAFGSNPAKEYMKSAFLREVSCVAVPSVPGTTTLALRSDEPDDTLHPPTIAEIENLFSKGLLDREEARALLADLPEYRMRIVLGGTAVTPVVGIKTEESRTEPVVVPEAPAEPVVAEVEPVDEDDDTRTLAASTAAAIREALVYFAKGTEEDTRQGLALIQAASVVTDDLLDSLGLEQPEARTEPEAEAVAPDEAGAAEEAREDPEAEVEERALSDKKWDPKPADYTLPQWKAACLIWDGPADEVGSGSLPVLEPDGSPNRAGMAAAAARLSQVDASDADKTAAAKKLLSLYGSNKLKAPGSLLQAARSVEDPETRALLIEAEFDAMDDLFARHGVEGDKAA